MMRLTSKPAMRVVILLARLRKESDFPAYISRLMGVRTGHSPHIQAGQRAAARARQAMIHPASRRLVPLARCPGTTKLDLFPTVTHRWRLGPSQARLDSPGPMECASITPISLRTSVQTGKNSL